MYNPPIELLLGEIKTQVLEKCEEAVYEAVVHYGVSVDREELLKALAYDRQQYEKGYRDAMAELVRCKDCKHFDEHTSKCYVFCNNEYEVQLAVDRDHFCSYGERRMLNV